jgi:DsbC/DsbD-like thiol-disulfide interchange protein
MRVSWLNSGSLFAFAGIVLSCAATVRAQTPDVSPARVQIVWENPIRPGHKFWAGVLFDLDPGWHIYWQNPGDSGEPPKLQWNLRPGYHGGEIIWPIPMPLGTGTIRDYGYEGKVLLLAPLLTPRDLDPTVPAELAATVKYVVCREICIPEKANLTLSVPVYKQPAAPGQPPPGPSPWRELFQATRAQIPNPPPKDWKVSAVSTDKNFVLSVEAPDEPNTVMFFPLDPGVIENVAPQDFAMNKKGFSLTLKKSEQLLKPVSRLRGVVVLDKNRAYEIAVPLKAQ